MNTTTDLLGRPLSALEQEILAVHEQLQHLAARADLPPCVRANSLAALALSYQMANDLDLRVSD